MKFYLLFFVPLFFQGCAQQPEGMEANVYSEREPNFDLPDSTIAADARTQMAFEEYVNQIPVLPIGYSKSCSGDLEIMDLIDTCYTPEGAQIIGRMQSINNVHFIIYAYPADILLPVLEVYNAFGKKMHEQPLLEPGICASTDASTDGTSEFTLISETAIETKSVYTHNAYNSSANFDTIHLEEFIRY
jgi:hypothetical protein